MNSIKVFIELLKLEERKAKALSELSKQISTNTFSEQQKIRAASIRRVC
jgi:hypothetical protein